MDKIKVKESYQKELRTFIFDFINSLNLQPIKVLEYDDNKHEYYFIDNLEITNKLCEIEPMFTGRRSGSTIQFCVTSSEYVDGYVIEAVSYYRATCQEDR